MGWIMPQEKISYEIKRRPRRRTVGIQISRDGQVYVLAPPGMNASDIESLIRVKSNWIEKHLARIKEKRINPVSESFKEGEKHLYLGRDYSLSFSPLIQERVKIEGNKIIIWSVIENDSQERCEKAKRQLQAFYEQQALTVLKAKVETFSQKMSLKPKGIQIKAVKTKWGSCNLKKILHFNWKLIFVAPALIDYVVVHELAHLKHFNHSAAFWNEVEKTIPDYKSCRRELRRMEWVL